MKSRLNLSPASGALVFTFQDYNPVTDAFLNFDSQKKRDVSLSSNCEPVHARRADRQLEFFDDAEKHKNERTTEF